jgi:pimeloyl-ACP methyl ester carboxylesterase
MNMDRRNFFKTTALTGASLTGASLASTWATQAVAAPAAASRTVWTPVAIPEQVPAKEGMADLPDTKLWYWDTGGDGVPVIFMHAGTQSASGWGYQQPVFAKAGHRVIAYSRRGYYKSDLGDKANPGIASEDLHHLIDLLKLDKVHLIALAHGGYFALDYALEHPDKVRSLTIVSSMMGVQDADYRALHARIRPKIFTDLPHDFQELGPSYRAGDPEGTAAWNKLVKEARPGGRVMPKFAHEITWAKLETIKTPTLLMTGDADLYTPPSVLRLQASHMPHAEVSIIAEAAHCANWEQPEVFNKTVLAFLAKH